MRAQRVLAVAAAAALTLVGCSDDDGSAGSTATTTTAAAPTTTASPTASPTGSPTGSESPTATSSPDTASATGSPSAAAAASPACPANGELIGFSVPLPDPNFELLNKVMTGDAERWGLKTSMTIANLNPGKQISDINSLLSKGAKVIVVAPVDPNALAPVLARAKQQNVPIVVTDTAIGGPYTTNVTTAGRESGAASADYIKEKVGAGPVAAILGPPFAEALQVRNEGFLARAKEIGLDVVEQTPNMQISPVEARRLADTWKQKYGAKLKAIWTVNDVNAVGASAAVGGAFQPAIVSINAQPDAVEAVKAGRITATFDLHPIDVGHTLAYAADQARCDKQLPKEIVIEADVVDKATVAEWRPWTSDPGTPTVTLEDRDGRSYAKVE
jgi:ribose transport system substrate-binding protein